MEKLIPRRVVLAILCAAGAHALSAPAQRVAAPTPATPAPATRRVARLDKPIRLPVWPVVNGLACIALDLVGLGDAAAALEERFGGRVAPMSLGPDANPFVLLVHHRHGFDCWDPVRPVFEKLIVPEGFPAHPHRGFETVTMTLRGGLAHRDSAGVKRGSTRERNSQLQRLRSRPVSTRVKETYGDGDVQWLTAGKGILHEEMWHWADKSRRGECELYQLWVNLPAALSMSKPPRRCSAADLATVAGDGVLETDLGGALTPDGAIRAPGAAREDVLLRKVELAPARPTRGVPADATALLYTRRGGGGGRRRRAAPHARLHGKGAGRCA
ncbi:quercetin 2,3-dioxygenase [Aureococcus anophagefferens]|nr:quercetin 2,3-dioxygenase [Aureococcus anophagefferens]